MKFSSSITAKYPTVQYGCIDLEFSVTLDESDLPKEVQVLDLPSKFDYMKQTVRNMLLNGYLDIYNSVDVTLTTDQKSKLGGPYQRKA